MAFENVCDVFAAVMFSENVTHGTMRWRSATERRALSYSYMPAYLSAGPSQAHAGHEVSLPQAFAQMALDSGRRRISHPSASPASGWSCRS